MFGFSPDQVFLQVIFLLLVWSLLSLGTSTLGLFLKPRDLFRGFWFMSAMWGLTDGIIALAGLPGPPLANKELAPILGMNAFLDVIYLVSGLIVFTRKKPLVRGFGLGILVQGTFLMVVDVAFWLICRA